MPNCPTTRGGELSKRSTRDLRNLFDKEFTPEFEAQKKRIAAGTVGGRNIKPEFASGGVVFGIDYGYDSVEALLRPREMVLNIAQQRRVAEMAGLPDVFKRAGVPGAGQVPVAADDGAQAFNDGGIVRPRSIAPSFITPSGGGGNGAPIEITINLNPNLSVGEETAGQITEMSAKTSTGRDAIVKIVKAARKFGDI